jgi:hypothetical protein
MRILLINQTWFASELRALGHEVLTCGMRPHLEYQIPLPLVTINDLLTQLPNGFRPDRIVWLDNSAPNAVLGLEDCEIPCLMYSVDTHHHSAIHAASAVGFDHVCGAQKDLLEHFSDSLTPTSWLPLWASEYVEASEEKNYGAVFVGTLNRKLNPARVAFFEAMQQLISIKVIEGHFPTIFPKAEIVLNQTVRGDLNFRVFEAMMCGAMLLTERIGNGLLELFEEGVHLVTYSAQDPLDAAEHVRSLIAQPKLMRSIAQQGRSEILLKHTAMHRALTLEAILKNLEKRAKDPRRYYGTMENLLSFSASAEPTCKELSGYTSMLAIKSALQALQEGAAPSDTTTLRIINACLRHDINFRDGIGARTIEEFAEALPQISIFPLLKLRNLLNTGRIAEARTLALSVIQNSRGDQTTIIDSCASEEDNINATFQAAERTATFLIDQLPKAPAEPQVETKTPPT